MKLSALQVLTTKSKIRHILQNVPVNYIQNLFSQSHEELRQFKEALVTSQNTKR